MLQALVCVKEYPHSDHDCRATGGKRAASLASALACCAVVLSATACEDAPRPRADAGDATAVRRDAPAALDTLMIEGQPEVLPVGTFTSGADFPLPFRTIVPDWGRLEPSIERESKSEGFSASARFEWTPASEPAFLRLVVLDSTMSDNDARGVIRSIATDFGIIGSRGVEYEEGVPPPAHAWSSFGYSLRGKLQGQAVEGWISMGSQRGKLFYFMALYPPEYADGLGPRFDFILRNWEWLGTGERLQP